MTEPDDLEPWLRLIETPGLGRAAARRLLAACGSPEGVLRAPPGTVQALAGSAAATALREEPPEFQPRLAATRQWLRGASAEAPRRMVPLGDPAYPPRLLQAGDPPLVLFVEGDAARLAAESLAIVGTRHPTPQGAENAQAFARALGDEGLVIVSGLALGVDAAAHAGALESHSGTIAVLGNGPDQAYPRSNAALARRIARHGALVSEYLPGTPPLRDHFPARNRIIAGLGLGTLVVEAAMPSGSLITARLAGECGREVFAIPGSIHSPQARGCHALIKQGAKLVESAADVLDELRATRSLFAGTGSAAGAAAAPREAPPPDPLLDALGLDPTTLDALQARTGWPTAQLNARLLELELQGRVARLPGGLFQRVLRG